MIWHEVARIERITWSMPSRWLKGYARCKLWTDPVYRAAWKLVGASGLPLLDVGCGMGLLAFYLRERGYTGAVSGRDVDARKIADGRAAIEARPYAGVDLQMGDCTELPEFSGHIALLDVLQYLPAPQRRQVLQELAARVAPGAWCIIRTTLRDGSWRYRATTLMERYAHESGWMARPAIAFPERHEIQAHFPLHDFEPEIRPLWGWTPFNSWLLAFRRRLERVSE